jgi:flagellar basal body-associated protein FliL
MPRHNTIEHNKLENSDIFDDEDFDRDAKCSICIFIGILFVCYIIARAVATFVFGV